MALREIGQMDWLRAQRRLDEIADELGKISAWLDAGGYERASMLAENAWKLLLAAGVPVVTFTPRAYITPGDHLAAPGACGPRGQPDGAMSSILTRERPMMTVRDW
jgi:N-acetyl-beta-hexosaminidase